MLFGNASDMQPLHSSRSRTAGVQEGVVGRQLKGWWPRQAGAATTAGHSRPAGVAAASSGAQNAPAGAVGRAGVYGPVMATARAHRGIAALLHKEGIGLEGWANAALTLSIDG